MKQAFYLQNLDTGETLLEEGLDYIFHPASFLKLFTALMARDILEAKLNPSPAQAEYLGLYREHLIAAIEASLRDSDNDALHYVVDFISETQSGLELEPSAFEDFYFRRSQISLHFASPSLRIANKCFEFDYYGRDRQLKAKEPNQASLRDIIKIVPLILESRSIDLSSMLKRHRPSADYQAEAFIAGALDLQGEFYSKAAWTSKVRHDLCVFPWKGARFLSIVMSEANSEAIFRDLVSAKLSKLLA